jgi:hypothetical protein
MPRKTNFTYYPELTVKENAELNKCSEENVRYFIRTRGIDRRFDSKQVILEDIKLYLKDFPNATKQQIAKDTRHGINTVKRYLKIINGESTLVPNNRRKQNVVSLKERKPPKPKKEHLIKDGYVYIATNPSFKDDIFKVGSTIDYEQRLKALSNLTSLPTPFEMVGVIKTNNCNEVEKYLHTLLSTYAERVNENREFFRGDINKAKELLYSVVTNFSVFNGAIVI